MKWLVNRRPWAVAALWLGLVAAWPSQAAVHALRAPQGPEDRPLGDLLASGRLRAGDVIELACGATYAESVSLSAAPGPLTIRAAAGCTAHARPQLRPTAIVTGWRAEPSGVQSAPSPEPRSLVLVDGAVLPQVRFPAQGFLHLATPLAPPPGAAGTATLGSREPPVAGERDWSGASLSVRNHGWVIETGTLRSAAAGQYQVSGLRTDAPAGAPFAVAGKRWMFDDPAAVGWAWDPADGRLYVRRQAGWDPRAHKVEVPRADVVLSANGLRGLQLSGFDIAGAAVDGVQCERCIQPSLTDMRVSATGRDGIDLNGSEAAVVSATQVRGAVRNGIGLMASRGASVNNSAVLDTGTGGWPQSSRAAINGQDSSDLTVRDSRIERSGYAGIRFHLRSRIEHNRVTDSCLALDDCGALYGWAGRPDAAPMDAVLAANIIDGVQGNPTDSPERYTLAAGIYLDDFARRVSVLRNAVMRAGRGVYLHNATDNRIEGNVVTETQDMALSISAEHAAMAGDATLPNIISGNLLAASRAGPAVHLYRRARTTRDRLSDNTIVWEARLPWAVERDPPNGRRLDLNWPDPGAPVDSTGTRVLVGRAYALAGGAEGGPAACPVVPEADCSRALDEKGQPVRWPLALQPWAPRWVYVETRR